jgi:hypothetical protein
MELKPPLSLSFGIKVYEHVHSFSNITQEHTKKQMKALEANLRKFTTR